jgi:hypothetical protein
MMTHPYHVNRRKLFDKKKMVALISANKYIYLFWFDLRIKIPMVTVLTKDDF